MVVVLHTCTDTWAALKYRFQVLVLYFRSTQPCIPLRSLNPVPASAGVRAGMSTLPSGRWHCVITCGMWVPVAVWQPCELLYTCYLLTSTWDSGTSTGAWTSCTICMCQLLPNFSKKSSKLIYFTAGYAQITGYLKWVISWTISLASISLVIHGLCWIYSRKWMMTQS